MGALAPGDPLARWRALGVGRVRDPDYRRYADARFPEYLRGRDAPAGRAALLLRHGRDGGVALALAACRARPLQAPPEHLVLFALLARLGQGFPPAGLPPAYAYLSAPAGLPFAHMRWPRGASLLVRPDPRPPGSPERRGSADPPSLANAVSGIPAPGRGRRALEWLGTRPGPLHASGVPLILEARALLVEPARLLGTLRLLLAPDARDTPLPPSPAPSLVPRPAPRPAPLPAGLDLLAYRLDAGAWESSLRAVSLGTAHLADWLGWARSAGYGVAALPFDALLADGPAAGGQVVALDGPGGRSYHALPAEALLTLESLLPRLAYLDLLARTPRLAVVELLPNGAFPRSGGAA